jgi:aminoglycoside phosphotransferase (APT) family kinase protein
VIAAADEAGVAVPHPLCLEPDGGRFGTAGYLMQWVDGEALAPRLLRKAEYAAARERLPEQLAGALARIHSIEPESVVPTLGAVPGDPALAAAESWEGTLDEVGEPLPAVETGLRWLRRNAPPPPDRAVVVHGDFRLGNFLADEGGLRAVLDWELCHLGDPAEDMGWLCVRSWRFGADDRRAMGLCSLDDFLAAYEAAGGPRLDRQRVLWWEALGNAKWAAICAAQARDHLTGRRPSHELAALGRRICEPEWDLLALIREAA